MQFERVHLSTQPAPASTDHGCRLQGVVLPPPVPEQRRVKLRVNPRRAVPRPRRCARSAGYHAEVSADVARGVRRCSPRRLRGGVSVALHERVCWRGNYGSPAHRIASSTALVRRRFCRPCRVRLRLSSDCAPQATLLSVLLGGIVTGKASAHSQLCESIVKACGFFIPYE